MPLQLAHSAPSCSIAAPSVCPPGPLDAPSMFPRKRPCSLSRTKSAIPNPEFGVYVIVIYIYIYGAVPLPKPRMLIEKSQEPYRQSPNKAILASVSDPPSSYCPCSLNHSNPDWRRTTARHSSSSSDHPHSPSSSTHPPSCSHRT